MKAKAKCGLLVRQEWFLHLCHHNLEHLGFVRAFPDEVGHRTDTFKNFFIFGCAASLLLYTGFLSCGRQGLLILMHRLLTVVASLAVASEL